jgi:hypothetical protein
VRELRPRNQTRWNSLGVHATGEENIEGIAPRRSLTLNGAYRRGVRCTDDGVLRYIWVPNVPADR